MKFIGGRIVKFRKQMTLSRAGLAYLMQSYIKTISGETIRQWELGRFRPREHYFEVLCKVLKKKPKDFFDF